MADDLDSFFQEINQVTAETASLVENSAYDLYGDNYDDAAKASATILSGLRSAVKKLSSIPDLMYKLFY